VPPDRESRRLQLNPSKTEITWFGSHVSLGKIAANDLSLRVGNDVVTPVDALRDLGVILDSELTMQRHVNKVAIACFLHIRHLKQIRRLLGPEATAILISAFVLSRLDCCNAVLAGLPKVTIAPLQRAQNAAARLILRLAPHDHVTAALRHLHWLPIQLNTGLLINSVYLCASFKSTRHCPISKTLTLRQHQSVVVDGFGPPAVPATGTAAATYETQIWSPLFVVCCTSRLEHSTAITATTL